MASTRIPPELLDDILACVGYRHDLVHNYEDKKARKRTLRYLAACSSVSVHWGNFIRPCMFQLLVLRSAQDLYDLLALLRMPCSPRIRSIAHCLRTVVVFYRFEDYFWCHSLQRLHTYGVHEELSLRIHIRGSAPRKKKCTVRHPLFYTVPRITPFHCNPLIHVDLIIEAVRFLDGAGLLKLIRDIGHSGIFPRSVRCTSVRWRDELTLPLDPILPLNQQPHVKPFDVTTTECTDNTLVAFAIRSCIGRRGRDVVMLDPSDANRFQGIFSEWASLLTPDFSIRSGVISVSPLFGREGDNSLSKANQGTTGYSWMLYRSDSSRRRPKPDEDRLELGFYMRPEQRHGPGGAQTAYICSIMIAICNSPGSFWLRPVGSDWETILHNALQCPMLETLEVSVNGWDELQGFVRYHRETLAVAESRGRLRLCLLDEEGYRDTLEDKYRDTLEDKYRDTLEDKYRRQVDLSEVIDLLANLDMESDSKMLPRRWKRSALDCLGGLSEVTILTDTDESDLESEPENGPQEPESLQPGPEPEDWRRVLEDEIESERAFNEARWEA